jgi:hypothetical protein
MNRRAVAPIGNPALALQMGRDRAIVEISMPGENLADGWVKIVGQIARAGRRLPIADRAPAAGRNLIFGVGQMASPLVPKVLAMEDDLVTADDSTPADQGAALRWLIEASDHRAATELTVQRLRIETVAERQT